MDKYLYLNIKYFNNNKISNYYNHIYEEKKIRLSKYLNKNKIKSSIIGEVLLEKLLKEKNIEYKKQQIHLNKNNKPYITNSNIYYNISHSYDYVIVIISDNEIGIDIEKIRKTNINTINKFATEKEKRYILSEKKYIYLRLFQIYTLKEAYIKMLGENISKIKEVEFEIKDNEIICSDKNVIAYTKNIIDDYIFAVCKKKS